MSAPTLIFRNVRVFDGVQSSLRDYAAVTISGAAILALESREVGPIEGATSIDGGGRVLMPGLIDAHVHTMLESVGLAAAAHAPIGYVYAAAVGAAARQLMRGFTSVRDAGGPSFGLKRAIDDGTCTGPRIFPSGAFVTQTAGHGDFRGPNDVPADPCGLSYLERQGLSRIADGPDAVLTAVREQLRQGASQIKMMAGGGVASDYDPLDSSQYTAAEFRAGVVAAQAWNTYVTVHAYTPKAIRTAVEAGVACIEHGQMIDEATAQLLAERGIWWCLQPFLDDGDATVFPEGSANSLKFKAMVAGTERAYEYARRFGAKTAFGTDILFDRKLADRQGAQLAKLGRWIDPVDALKMATSTNAELLALSGPRNPYPGKLGVVEPGALADLLLVEGDPTRDLAIVADPEANFRVIVKNGTVYKNAL